MSGLAEWRARTTRNEEGEMERLREQTTLVGNVADEIRGAIIRRKLVPGSALREAELAETYGVSRGTLREALRSLQEEGLVEVIPFRGAFVPTLSARHAREIFSVRAQLEPWAVRLAMEEQAFSERDFRGLEALIRRMDEYLELEDVYHHASTDAQFHMMICERSDHELLVEMIKMLRWKTILYQAQLVTTDTSHGEILQAIRTGDPDKGAAVMERHITEAGERLIEALRLEVATDDHGLMEPR